LPHNALFVSEVLIFYLICLVSCLAFICLRHLYIYASYFIFFEILPWFAY
jgi:hypothetical protein